MNVVDAAKFLTASSALTGREPTEEQAVVWSAVLDEISLEDALKALRSHYRRSRFPVMPADIVNHVNEMNVALDRELVRAGVLARQRLANFQFRQAIVSSRELLDSDVVWDDVGWSGDEKADDVLATPIASIE